MLCPNICWISISNYEHHPNIEKMVVVVSWAVLLCSSNWKTQDKRKMDEVKYRKILQENVVQSTRALGFGK